MHVKRQAAPSVPSEPRRAWKEEDRKGVRKGIRKGVREGVC